MWPWEHLAIGYILYSLYVRTRLGGTLTDRAALAVVVGTQFPDLVDKPLGWVLTVMPDGTTVGHSLFVAVPLSVLVYELTRRRDRPDVGLGFATGYLTHLPSDVLYPLAYGDGPAYEKVLWPVATSHDTDILLIARISEYSRQYLDLLLSPEGFGYAVLEILLLLGALLSWVDDGMPGVGWLRDRLGGR